MARADYINQTKDLLYGSGLGEKPSIRRAAAAAQSSETGGIATFVMSSGEGDKLRAGQVLSAMSASSESTAYVFYVLSLATDTVTAVAQYFGGPAISATTSLNSVLFEQSPLVTDKQVHQAVDTIFSKFLWPTVWKYNQRSLTPDMSTLQSSLPSAAEDVESAFQVVSNVAYQIPVGLVRNLSTSIASSGTLIQYDDLADASTLYLTTKERYAMGDESAEPALVRLVAFGAAAMLLDSTVSAAAMEKAKKESTVREVKSRELWGAFLQMRQSWMEDLVRENDVIRYIPG